MIITPQFIDIQWTTKNKKYFESKGYCFTKKYSTFKVSVLDLQLNSNINIKCKCDYCNSEFLRRFSCISKFLHAANDYQIACNNCTSKRIKQTNLERYGVEVPSQNKDIKNKSKLTCIKKYGVEYTGQSNIKKQKTIQTNLEKYGVEYNLQRKEIRAQIKKTNIKKYGCEHATQNQHVKEKIKKTNLERYNTEYTWQNQHVKDKIKKTNLEKYNVECTLQSEVLREKAKQTNLKKYGFEYPIQNHDIKEKRKQTNLEKYGYEYPTQNNDIKEKINTTMFQNGTAPCSKQQKHLCKLLNGKLNYPLGQCKLDIAFLKEKLCIEYNGGGHDLQVKKGYTTQTYFKQKELRRDKFIKSNSWKLIKIVSSNDKLPNDNIIKNLFNDAKNYLLNSSHKWYIIDIDKAIIQCAEYTKEIKLGTLRRI